MRKPGQRKQPLTPFEREYLAKAEQHERELKKLDWREKAERALAFRAELLPFVWHHHRSLPQEERISTVLTYWPLIYQESLIYLVSRGKLKPTNDTCLVLKNLWEALQTTTVRGWTTIQDLEGRTLSIQQAWEIERHSSFTYPDFWKRDEELDATMLRAVDWCEFGGFDPWWARLKKAEETSFFCDAAGLTTEAGSLWLFAMCRSQTAVQLMRFLLLASLVCFRYRFEQTEDILLSAVVMFAAAQLGTSEEVIPERILKTAAADLQRRATDWWSSDRESSKDIQPEVVTTAICLHALAVTKPHGWHPAAAAACQWLMAQQDSEDGLWHPGEWRGILLGRPLASVWTTVLVLDALDLVNGQEGVSFQFERILRDRRRAYRLQVKRGDNTWVGQLDRDVFNLDPDQAAFLTRLIEADGAAVNGSEFNLTDRAARVKASLPPKLRSLVQSSRGKGYWIPVASILA